MTTVFTGEHRNNTCNNTVISEKIFLTVTCWVR